MDKIEVGSRVEFEVIYHDNYGYIKWRGTVIEISRLGEGIESYLIKRDKMSVNGKKMPSLISNLNRLNNCEYHRNNSIYKNKICYLCNDFTVELL